jgi:LmbE family N-acetylglucosaminyl deacetylase
MTKVLFISVHPDDETLGCGGTILKHKKMGNEIYWLNITGPTIDHPFGFSKDLIDERNQLIEKINLAYEFHDTYNLNLPTQMLDTIEMRLLIKAIDKVISKWEPEILCITNSSDVHSDHKVAFDAIYSCTKNFRKPFINKILMYETLSETEFSPALMGNAFVPNYFEDISDFIDKKIEIMEMYNTEIMPTPYPRSIHAIKGLAAFRGSRIGVMYAEAFMLLFMKKK